MSFRLTVLLAGLAVASPLQAQETSARLGDILQAILLPRSSEELRKEGVPEDEVRVAIEEAIRKRIPASESNVLMEEATKAVRESGPIDNFGAYVKTQLASGLRGRDLAAAIHAEHARRGIGKGKRLEAKKGAGGPEGKMSRPGGPAGERGPAEAAEAAKGRAKVGGEKPKQAEKDSTDRPGKGRGAQRDTTQRQGGSR